MSTDEQKPDPQSGNEDNHRTIIIVATVVMVVLPLILGALRLLGYL